MYLNTDAGLGRGNVDAAPVLNREVVDRLAVVGDSEVVGRAFLSM